MTITPFKQKIQIVTVAENNLLLLQFAQIHNCGFQNITGSVEEGETFQMGAQRELLEETGITAQVKDIEYLFKFKDRWGYEVTEKVFLCELKKIPSIVLSDEHQSYKWIPIEKVSVHDFVFPTNFEAFQKALEFRNE